MEWLPVLVILLLLALIPAKIASNKGRDGQTWFLLGLLFWPAAISGSLLVRDLRPEQEMKVAPTALSGSAFVRRLERAGPSQQASSTPCWDGTWRAVVTVTTVGYGDLYPTTVTGPIGGIVVMLTGLASSQC